MGQSQGTKDGKSSCSCCAQNSDHGDIYLDTKKVPENPVNWDEQTAKKPNNRRSRMSEAPPQVIDPKAIPEDQTDVTKMARRSVKGRKGTGFIHKSSVPDVSEDEDEEDDDGKGNGFNEEDEDIEQPGAKKEHMPRGRVSVADELEEGAYDNMPRTGGGSKVEVGLYAHSTHDDDGAAKEKVLSVNLNKERGGELGIDVDWEDGETLCVTNIRAGALKAWNDIQPKSRQVQVGDRIISVNGSAGDGPQHLSEMLDTYVALKISIHTHNELLVDVIKSQPNELGIDTAQSGRTLLITYVNSGLIDQWNTKHREAPVMQYDRIVAVNDFRGSGKDMQAKLNRTSGSIFLLIAQHK